MWRGATIAVLIVMSAGCTVLWSCTSKPVRSDARLDGEEASLVSVCGGTFQSSVRAGHQVLEYLPQVDIWFGDDVAEADRARVREGLTHVQQYLVTHFTAAVPANACVDVRTSNGGPVGSGRMNSGRILLITAPEGWPIAAAWSLPSVVAHEYVHVWQEAIAGPDAFYSSPVWLVEGMAQWIAFNTMAEAGLLPVEDLSCWLERAPGLLRPRLSSLETPEGWRAYLMNYQVSLEGIDTVVGRAGELGLQSYLTNLGRGENWAEAFEAAFGLAPAAFYRSFDATDVPVARLKSSPLVLSPHTSAPTDFLSSKTDFDLLKVWPSFKGPCHPGSDEPAADIVNLPRTLHEAVGLRPHLR